MKLLDHGIMGKFLLISGIFFNMIFWFYHILFFAIISLRLAMKAGEMHSVWIKRLKGFK